MFTFYETLSLLKFTQFTRFNTANTVLQNCQKMIDMVSSPNFSYYFNPETLNVNVLELMESFFGPVPFNFVNIEDSLIKENWHRFSKISNVNLSVISPLVPYIFSNVNVKPTGVLKLFWYHPKLIREHVNTISSRPLASITKGPENDVTRNFKNSVQEDMDFRYCFSPYCFSDQVVTSCIGLLIQGPWFTFAHTEIGGGASFASLNKGTKMWCDSISSTGTRLFERCSHSPECFK